MAPCPHCHATAEAERSAALRWRCAVCGGPLVPSDGSFPRTGAELPSLVGAARAGGIAVGWAAATFVLGGSGLTALLLALLLWHAAHLAGLCLGVLAGAALALALASAMRSRQRRSEARGEIDRAWASVAGELLAARGADLTATDVARALHVEEAYAQALLSELSAEGRVRVAVGDDAQLSYRPAVEDDAEAGEAAGDKLRRGS